MRHNAVILNIYQAFVMRHNVGIFNIYQAFVMRHNSPIYLKLGLYVHLRSKWKKNFFRPYLKINLLDKIYRSCTVWYPVPCL